MTSEHRPTHSRALVLGGGGVTGIAWEVGILAGLHDSGVDLREADVVIGTSAGSFVGVAVASGYDLDALFTAQIDGSIPEVTAVASDELITAWYGAFETGRDDPRAVGASFGQIARDHPAATSPEVRGSVVTARLVTHQWPASLRVAAIDADSGELQTLDATGELSLIDAVSASGAVPGLWPMVQAGSRSWVDGGMVSTANARLADGYGRIVVVAPMPDGYGSIPGAREDVAELSRHARVTLLTPDSATLAAIGPNPYDPDRRPASAAAGRAQGSVIARDIAAMWLD